MIHKKSLDSVFIPLLGFLTAICRWKRWRASAVRTRNIKRWWLANMKLQTSASAADALHVMDELETIADEEEKNVQAAKAAVMTDSRLGWEPSMEYVCDEWHLDWKLRQMEGMRREMCTYRGILNDVIAARH